MAGLTVGRFATEWRWAVSQCGAAVHTGRCQCSTELGKEDRASIWAGWATQVDWAKILGRKSFRINWIFGILLRLWKFTQGDLGGILMWKIFLNSSRILMDFIKIQYAMP
jgi:hypothetical protein